MHLRPDATWRTVTWFAGLSESAVPVYVGDHILGFLETGEVMLKNPTKKHFASITRQLRAWGYKANWRQLERAYFRSVRFIAAPVSRDVAASEYFCATPFHLCRINWWYGAKKTSPPTWRGRGNLSSSIRREPLSLGRVAHAANISRHYFCKMFKKATGMNFIDYPLKSTSREIENFLLNPNSRISEAAFAAAFNR
jgi:AraC-like DNA-binding protein